ncbi:ABC transporter permease [Nocardia cyriacigeorgica]|uniref:Transport permease protein n=1 Tax=Nocardia cyriacigeorgica TaxID=135487 RepID=A0A6P1DHY1_9NOCA|nr:ABC transporter permease [Nocardia cyriacigeorgica]NEW38575.1 ABC transporter permease [Nocardia cyriacigeorgica]NEW48240.1 ABC transporter permease [Nocardia cyriacigeorgica]NEW49600.1 ABC transporter permease [Nocardia cyriacigeorgica]NEW59517.1 ABC transporter permease [Nocardia cyriacigeorgica]
MTTATWQAEPSRFTGTMTDSLTMLRRNLLHVRRYPSMAFSILIMPIVLMMIFNYVFGGALEAGLEPGAKYIDYLAPGMLLLLPAYLTVSVAVSLATDATKGIVNRFRVMSIAQSAMLTGHVVGTLIQGAFALVGMLGVAMLMGFRPDATPIEWVAVIGLLLLVVFAFTWLAVAFGLVAPNPESASNMPFPIVMLPFLGSGLVPTDTMPTVLRWFAEYQPFTPITETVRGLLMGTEIGANGIIALGWCVGIAATGYLWSMTLFKRQSR